MGVFEFVWYIIVLKPAKSRYIHFFKIFIYFGNGQKYLNF